MKKINNHKKWKWIYNNNLLFSFCILMIPLTIIFSIGILWLTPILPEEKSEEILELKEQAEIIWHRHLPGSEENINIPEKGYSFCVNDKGISASFSNYTTKLKGYNENGELVFVPLSYSIKESKIEIVLKILVSFAVAAFVSVLISKIFLAKLIKDFFFIKIISSF